MANQSEAHVEWQRLTDVYHAMQDEELLELAGERGELTDVARDVLERELKVRRLEPPAPAGKSDGESEPARSSVWTDVSGQETKTAMLMTSYDALEMGRICRYLEEKGIPFELKDVSSPQSGLRSFTGGPAVALQLIVPARDKEGAMALLREKMGLFPLQEVDEDEETVDDEEVLFAVGSFGRREQVTEVEAQLEGAGVWHRVVSNPEGTVEDENCYLIEVRESDLERAAEIVEKSLDLLED